jgi:hypothetical protein
LVAEIVEVAHRFGIPVWLRGGWAVDFYLGRITREHRDIDWFVDVAHADRLVAALEDRGFAPVPGVPPQTQRDLAKDGEDVSFALVGRESDGQAVVPAGPYAGELWPVGMLGERVGRIGEQAAPVIEPAAQVEIKTSRRCGSRAWPAARRTSRACSCRRRPSAPTPSQTVMQYYL